MTTRPLPSALGIYRTGSPTLNGHFFMKFPREYSWEYKPSQLVEYLKVTAHTDLTPSCHEVAIDSQQMLIELPHGPRQGRTHLSPSSREPSLMYADQEAPSCGAGSWEGKCASTSHTWDGVGRS